MTEELSNEPTGFIAGNIERIRGRIALAAEKSGRAAAEISLVAVTKTKPASYIDAAVAAGVALIGENRVQELLQKLPQVTAKGTQYHIIGHLQTNKVRQIIGCVDMIQSLDSIRLAREIDRQAEKAGRIMDVLMEVNIGTELSKSGVAPAEAMDFAEALAPFFHLRLRGLMAVPPALADKEQLRPYFRQMRKLFIDIGRKKSDNRIIDILSMGMSSDFETAIEEGSNMVRVGSAIFGQRDYSGEA